jgi:HD-like signal output (HDOD) protein
MKSAYPSASALVASVHTLLTLPDVYLRVKSVIEDPYSCLSDMVNAISIDPGISARLLKLVNSAYFNLGIPVDNIRQAVNLLGMKPVHDLVLATSLTNTFSHPIGNAMDMRTFWEDSVRRAIYARLLALRCDINDHERLFVTGLMSNIGHQVMYLQMTEQTRVARQKSLKTGTTLSIVENDLFGFNYADVGAELMLAWDMPASLSEVLRYQHNPEQAGHYSMDSAIVHIANALTYLPDAELDPNIFQMNTSPAAWRISGLSTEDVIPLRDQAVAELDEAIGMLLGKKNAA